MLPINKLHTYFLTRFEIEPSTNNWFIFDNPFDVEGAGKKKMAVQYQYKTVKCWRTGYKESIVKFISQYEGIKEAEVYPLIFNLSDSALDLKPLSSRHFRNILDVQIEMPPGFKLLSEGIGTNLGERAIHYLESRGFDYLELDEEGFGYCNETSKDPKWDYFGYLIIPFKIDGTLRYYIGRDFLGHRDLRYKNPPVAEFKIGKSDLLFNQDALYIEDEVFLTEGWADARTLGHEGSAYMGLKMSDEQIHIVRESSCKTLVFVPDIGFIKQAAQNAFEFVEDKEIYILDLRRVAKESEKDANEVGQARVRNLRRISEPLTASEIMGIIVDN